MPSTPGALPVFSCWITVSISCVVKSLDRLESQPRALCSSWTLVNVVVKSLFALGKRPLLSSSDAMEFAVIGHCAGVVDLPVSLLMVCHARRLECVKSIYSTVSVHLCLRFSFSLQNRSFAAMPLSSLVCASVWARSRSSHSSSQQGT